MRRRSWLVLLSWGIVAAAPACLPDPDQDFTDYQTRIKSYVPPTPTATDQPDAGPIDSGPPPTQVTEGTYFASCLSELANGQVTKTFSFWATTKFTPNTDVTTGGTLSVTLEALKLDNGAPPTTISRANVVSTLPEITGTTDPAGSFVASLPAGVSATFLGTANPISGSNVEISGAGLKGRFATAAFCARLTGHVVQPAPAERDLDENKNFCLFTPVTEGATVPTRTFQDYSVAKCPL